MVESEGPWAKDTQPYQKDRNIEASFFSPEQTWEDPVSMQDPGASIPSIMGSRWTLPGSQIGKDGTKARDSV